MRICPKCRQTYADSVDFCPRDGKPLVNSDAVAAPPDPRTAPPAEGGAHASGEATPREGGRNRSPALFQTGVLQSVRPPEPVASVRRDAEPPRSPLPTFKAWVPGQARESSVAGVKLTMPTGSASQLPPWEINAAPPKPFQEAQPAPVPVPAAEPEPEEETIVRTPDLPLPPEQREEAVPVGDETVLVPEETLDLGDSLELETITPPPEPELPLVSRVTTRAALPRAVVTPLWGPPVADEPEEEEQKLAILTEDDAEPPVIGEDTDSHYIVVSPGRAGRSAASAALEPASAPRRSNAMLLGMAAVALVAAAVVLYLLIGNRSASSGPDGRTSSVEAADSAAAAQDASGVGRPEQGAGSSTSAGSVGEAQAASNAVKVGGAQAGSGGSSPTEAGNTPPTGGSSGSTASSSPGSDSSASGPAGGSSVNGGSSVASPGGAGSSAGKATASPGAEAGEAPSAAVPAVRETTHPVPAVRETTPAAPTGVGRTVASKTATPAPEARAATARLTVESLPSGAMLILDGQPSGTTPRTVNAPLGRHTIRLTRDGFNAAETVVSLDTPDTRKISMSLERINTGAGLTLLITSNEIGADVYVDNTRAGSTPLTISLPAGKHVIKVAPQGKPEKEETINVAGDLPPNQREKKYFAF